MIKRSLNAAIEFSVMKTKGKKDKVRKFDESIDLIINIKDVNLKDPKQRIDKELILPYTVISNDKPNICIIASDEVLLQAKKIGVDTLDSAGLASMNQEEKKYKKKFVKKYDFFVVEDKLMRDVARYLARFLGPAGKMPKPFPSGYGIVSSPEELMNSFERYKRIIRVQMKKTLVIQMKVGKKSMKTEEIFGNIKEIVNFLADQMPHKFNNFKSAFLKTTMGRPIKIDEKFLKSVGV